MDQRQSSGVFDDVREFHDFVARGLRVMMLAFWQEVVRQVLAQASMESIGNDFPELDAPMGQQRYGQ